MERTVVALLRYKPHLPIYTWSISLMDISTCELWNSPFYQWKWSLTQQCIPLNILEIIYQNFRSGTKPLSMPLPVLYLYLLDSLSGNPRNQNSLNNMSGASERPNSAGHSWEPYSSFSHRSTIRSATSIFPYIRTPLFAPSRYKVTFTQKADTLRRHAVPMFREGLVKVFFCWGSRLDCSSVTMCPKRERHFFSLLF